MTPEYFKAQVCHETYDHYQNLRCYKIQDPLIRDFIKYAIEHIVRLEIRVSELEEQLNHG